jgi:alpha-glucosidase
MWTDIDYMDRRRVFTLDPERFPLEKMRELVDHLHKHDQHYIVMVDPAVSDSGKYIPPTCFNPFDDADSGTL